jgi:hypothetical protein
MFAGNGLTVAAGGSPWSSPAELRALAGRTPADDARDLAWRVIQAMPSLVAQLLRPAASRRGLSRL